MIEDVDHFQVVAENLDGRRTVDEQTLASLAILSERLERLKRFDGIFEGVRFSPAVDKLRRRRNAVAVS
jgi:hypothetical protein